MNKTGRWDLDKRPVIYEYTADLRCGVCDLAQLIQFRADPNRKADLPPDYPGDWRKIYLQGGHANPLQQVMVVCSRDCAEKYLAEHINELYPAQ